MTRIKINKQTGDSAVINGRRLIASFTGKNGKRRAEVFVKLASRETPEISAELARELAAVEMPWRAFRLGLQMGGRR